MRGSRVLIGCLLAAAMAACAAPALAQRRCAASEPVVRVDSAPARPALDTLPMADLRRMSREGLGEHDQALGLYKAELHTGLRLEYSATGDGRTACIGLRDIVVTLQLAERRIYIARELPRGSCRHDVTLAHEQRHARIDDTILARELPRVKQALARAATDIGTVGPVPVRDVQAHQEDIGERLQRVLRHELDRISETRRREQGAIDTPESYRREAERCPDGMK
jgi:hypothetical protein